MIHKDTLNKILLTLALLLGVSMGSYAKGGWGKFAYHVIIDIDSENGDKGTFQFTSRIDLDKTDYTTHIDTIISGRTYFFDIDKPVANFLIYPNADDGYYFDYATTDLDDEQYKPGKQLNFIQVNIPNVSLDQNNPTLCHATLHISKAKEAHYTVVAEASKGGKVAFSVADDNGIKQIVSRTPFDTLVIQTFENYTTALHPDYGEALISLLADPDEGYYFDHWTGARGETEEKNFNVPNNGQYNLHYITVRSDSFAVGETMNYAYRATFIKGKDIFFRVKATAITEGGKVAVLRSAGEEPKYAKEVDRLIKEGVRPEATSATLNTVTLVAQPDEGYSFVRWKDPTGNTAGTSPELAIKSLTSSVTDSTKAELQAYTAEFEKLNVYLGDENTQYGDVSIEPKSCKMGDEVTLTATPFKGLVNAKFLGWVGPDGSTVSTDNVYKFTVSEATKGKYYALFEGTDMSKGYYCSLVNYGYYSKPTYALGLIGVSQNRIGVDGRHGIPRYPAFALMGINVSNERMHASPAFVIKLSGDTRGMDGGIRNANMAAQGISVDVVAAGIGTVNVIRATEETMANSKKESFGGNVAWDGPQFYHLQGKVGGVQGYVVDWGDTRVPADIYGPNDFVPGLYNGTAESLTDHPYWWNIGKYSEEDSTENYFGAMPYEGMKIGDLYYTTMYTVFPYKCLDGVKAYVVDKINANGTLHLNRIESGIVPANTPVILECRDWHPRHNRLLPLDEDVAPYTGTNYLRGELWLLKNERVSLDSCRTRFDASKMRVMNYDGADFQNVNNTNYYVTYKYNATTGQTDINGQTGVMPWLENNTCWLDVSSISNPLPSYTIKQNLNLDGDSQTADNWNSSIAGHEGPAKVTLKRSFADTSSWYTLCLPFNLTDKQLADAFGEDYDLEDNDASADLSATSYDFKFKKVKSLKAGYPYLLKQTKGNTTTVFDGVTMQATEITPVTLGTDKKYTFQGTEKFNSEDIRDSKYNNLAEFFISLGLYAPDNGNAKLKGTRCFLIFPDEETKAKPKFLMDDGTATGIDSISNDGAEVSHSKIYNLQGQNVGNDLKSLHPGVYIQNGKKLVIK